MLGLGGNGEQNARADAENEKGRAAVAHEGQRHAHHGQDTTDHAHVDEGVREEDAADGARKEAGEARFGEGRNVEAAADERSVERKQDEVADKAEFLAENGEEEVARAFGNEVVPLSDDHIH